MPARAERNAFVLDAAQELLSRSRVGDLHCKSKYTSAYSSERHAAADPPGDVSGHTRRPKQCQDPGDGGAEA